MSLGIKQPGFGLVAGPLETQLGSKKRSSLPRPHTHRFSRARQALPFRLLLPFPTSLVDLQPRLSNRHEKP